MHDQVLSTGGDLAEHLRRVFERARALAPPVFAVIGSARGDGDTARLTRRALAPIDGAVLADLNDFRVGAYDYDFANADDDFLTLARAMTGARAIVFASPVYWYSMSAPMKAFFDRLTDLTESHKPWGKSLAGKTAFLIASGGSPAPHPAFEPPFAETADYFDMNWGGMLYGQKGDVDDSEFSAFAAKIRNATQASTQARVQELA